ncbi:DUF2182 domain-containing protein [Glycomyces buryatensis]|uniref:DUF2182 domain-containing protein n=1 Tax=Glycomyces buryatensis TaxID=2570927 RepID=A0A4S8QHN3_9ACTN|nr:DUF2182 domain-containing protein [Glycomyces buryatensis]THV42475.1 DUF2182 domain-containing protein [Glycomyces buryatensis]
MTDLLQRARARIDWGLAGLPAALALVAIAGLVLWDASPSLSHYMHLAGPDHHDETAAPEPLALAGLFSAAWLLMTVAHMVPTMIPLLAAFRKVTGEREWRHGLMLAVVAGFLTVWAVAGIVVSAVHVGILEALSGVHLDALGPWLLVFTLALAGNYQLSRYANRCLHACRTPLSFLAGRWTGTGRPGREAFGVGLDYGRSCLGCCAALMVVMFAVGSAGHGWMVLFALLSVLQKNAPWGPKLSKPIGVAFLAAATIIAFVQVMDVIGPGRTL